MTPRQNLILSSLFMAVIFCSSVHASNSPDLDQAMKIGDQIVALEKILPLRSDEKSGPLVAVYACIQAQVAVGKLAEKMAQSFSVTILESIRSIPFGTRMADELKKQDPHFFEMNLEVTPYEVECRDKLDAARADTRVRPEVLAETIRLSEIGGVFLGRFMTSEM